MKKQFLSVALVAAMLFTGCSKEASTNNEKETNKETKKTEQSASGNISLTEIKARYATIETKNNVIEPLYNVAPDEEFEFKFAYDLTKGGYGTDSLVSVHTDINCEKSSMIYTKAVYDKVEGGGSLLTVSPLSAVLSTEGNDDDYWNNNRIVWGNAPMFYIAIWYDMNAEELTKLDKPIVIPFTILHEAMAPEVKGVVDAEGCFSLQWEPVEGATEYRIYSYVDHTKNSTGYFNEPLDGAKNGYSNASLVYLATVDGDKTSFENFSGEGGNKVSFERNVSGKEYVMSQNPCVYGEYYVSAVVNGKESGFACKVTTAELKIPYKVAEESDILLKRFTSVEDLPLSLDVVNIDGSISNRKVLYTFQMEDTYLEGKQVPEYAYKIEGTAITGCVFMDVEDPNFEYPETIGEGSQVGAAKPEDNIPSQPSSDIITIPEDAKDDGSVIEDHINNSKNEPEDTPDEPVDTPDEPGENTVAAPQDGYLVFADSAAEEWIALNMINGETRISIADFPELQTKEMLMDVLEKVYNQNPYILGLYSYSFDYNENILEIGYAYSKDELVARQQEIFDEAHKVLDEIIDEDMSDEAKQLAIYMYLEENTEYDFSVLERAAANNYKKIDDPEFEDSFNTYGILVKKVGVCQSYAHVFKLLGRMAGLECDIATGNLSGNLPHAWNFVNLDGGWYQLDSTNNLNTAGVPFFAYNADTDTALTIGLAVDDRFELNSNLAEYDSNNDDYEYYNINDLCVKSQDEYVDILTRELEEGNENVAVRFECQLPTQQEIINVIGEAYNMVGLEDKLPNLAFRTAGNYVYVYEAK